MVWATISALMPASTTKMDVWGQACVDLAVPGFIEFEMEYDHLMGQLRFGTVVGMLDCRLRDIGHQFMQVAPCPS